MQPNFILKDIIYRMVKNTDNIFYEKENVKMKKLLSTLIIVSMLSAAAVPLATAAQTSLVSSKSISVTDSEAMKSALVNVKNRIDIPGELTEFSGNAFDYAGDDSNGAAHSFSFNWYNIDYSKSLRVMSDLQGRITSYYYSYNTRRYDDSSVLSKVPEDKAKQLTEEFIKKLIPEAFVNPNDTLEIASYKVSEYSNSEFQINYKRVKDGTEVYNNSVSITADYADDTIIVERAIISYDYDAVFSDETDSLLDPVESYRKLFPEELTYSKKYNNTTYKNNNQEKKVVLQYGLKNYGYISAVTGDELKLKENNTVMPYPIAGGSASSMDAAEKNESVLTREEITELDEISKLYSPSEAESFLRSLPKLKLSSSMKLERSSIYSNNTTPKAYRLLLYMTDNSSEKHRSLNASFDAGNKRLTGLSTYIPYTADNNYTEPSEPITREQLAKYNAESDKFLNAAVGDKLGEFKENESDRDMYSNVYRSFTRIVNGIPYTNNGINLTYDVKNDIVTTYSLTYEDDAVFPAPENIISADDAYKKLIELSKLTKLYIPTEDGYRLAYTCNSFSEIDAFTGEDLNKSNDYDAYEISYNDISGHWCEASVKELAANGISLKGESFKPDDAITQEDILRLLLASNNRYMLNLDTDSLYEHCYNLGLITEDERNPQSTLTREQAFVYMIRTAGYERIAKLSDIYKVSYSDSDKLSHGLIGYAAILSGMGVINGDGSELRPQDHLTRAEAAAMLYNYMKQ